jgi:NADP-dependent 3-hydroxy acid dehydrogenase YdfG
VVSPGSAVHTATKHAVPADSFAPAVAFAIGQPDDVEVNEILYRPTSQEL